MKSRFIPEDFANSTAYHRKMLVDPPIQQGETWLVDDPADSYDASEQQFAASLERNPSPRFFVDEEDRAVKRDSQPHPGTAQPQPAGDPSVGETSLNGTAETATPQLPELFQSENAWRRAVAAKLSRYRARRRLPVPRYSSLQLPLEVPEPCREEQPATPSPTPNRLALAIQEVAPDPQPPPVEAPAPAEAETGDGAKILEFPRFFSAPRPAVDELAEPVFDRPRILEVPEQLPPPPALGGILIEPEEKVGAERRPGFELPLNPPSMARRMSAGLIDLSIVGISFAAFAVMFFRVTHAIPPIRQAAGICAGIVAAVWFVYQYLFLVYLETTPGLKLTRLQLSRFDGTPAPRSLRRWRVLASVLSGLSLALGYAWCFFDEDQLCWHDRITHTYMARVPIAALAAESEASAAQQQTV